MKVILPATSTPGKSLFSSSSIDSSTFVLASDSPGALVLPFFNNDCTSFFVNFYFAIDFRFDLFSHRSRGLLRCFEGDPSYHLSTDRFEIDTLAHL